MNRLSQRKNDILLATIEDYIKDASPITSGNVKERYLPSVSSATLRSELSALEAMGYLKQIHTSGGRVPTVEGYRYYVESLLGNLKVDNSKLERISYLLGERSRSINEIVSELAKIISQATKYPTVVLMNGYDNLLIEEIKIVSLIDQNALILIRTVNGIVNNSIKTVADQKACDDAARLLTNHFSGKTIGHLIENISEVKGEIQNTINDYQELVENLILGLKQLVASKTVGIRSAGSVKMLESGESVNGAKKILDILEDEMELEKLLEVEENLTFNLAEDGEKYSGLAVVKAPLKVGGKSVGSIGVLGPQRMDYMAIASAIKFLTNELENINKLEDKNGKK